jgi:DNA-binding NarL/FixJ family response regulator
MTKKLENIIMVDDNVQFRTNLKIYIERALGLKVIAEASNGREFLNLPNLTKADIILMDIAMDEMDGIEATKRALWIHPYLDIVAITMHAEKIYLVQLIESGFKGCIIKSDIYSHLRTALKTVKQGKLYIPDNILLDRNEC